MSPSPSAGAGITGRTLDDADPHHPHPDGRGALLAAPAPTGAAR